MRLLGVLPGRTVEDGEEERVEEDEVSVVAAALGRDHSELLGGAHANLSARRKTGTTSNQNETEKQKDPRLDILSDAPTPAADEDVDDEGVPHLVLAQRLQRLRVEREADGECVESLATRVHVLALERRVLQKAPQCV